LQKNASLHSRFDQMLGPELRQAVITKSNPQCLGIFTRDIMTTLNYWKFFASESMLKFIA